MGKQFFIKQILRKLTLSREHIAHTLTEDIVPKSKVKNNKTINLLPEVANVQKN